MSKREEKLNEIMVGCLRVEFDTKIKASCFPMEDIKQALQLAYNAGKDECIKSCSNTQTEEEDEKSVSS